MLGVLPCPNSIAGNRPLEPRTPSRYVMINVPRHFVQRTTLTLGGYCLLQAVHPNTYASERSLTMSVGDAGNLDSNNLGVFGNRMVTQMSIETCRERAESARCGIPRGHRCGATLTIQAIM